MSELIAGVDGCNGGWIVALRDLTTESLHFDRVATMAELFDRHPNIVVAAIDMPIGLPERSGPKGRAAERAARPNLGGRQSSVFSIPSRSAVYAGVDLDIPEAERFRHCCAVARETSAEGKAVSKQGFAIFPKIVEIDAWLCAHRDIATRVYECHPEVSFWAMNGDVPLAEPKKVKGRVWEPGLDLRRGLLLRHGFDCAVVTEQVARRFKTGLDDLIDACAACWTAARIAEGQARSFPDVPERDACELPIAIWA